MAGAAGPGESSFSLIRRAKAGDADVQALYKRALAALADDERALVVARVELGYSYEQIAVALEKPSADAARMAVGRAVVRPAEGMQLR